jgi:hypothetical protein
MVCHRRPEATVRATIGCDGIRAAIARFATYFAEANNDQFASLFLIAHHASGAGARP